MWVSKIDPITRSFWDSFKLSKIKKRSLGWSFATNKSGHIIVPMFHQSAIQLHMQSGGLKCTGAQKNLAFKKYPNEAILWCRVSNGKDAKS